MFLYGERNYLQEQSIPDIVKNALGIFRDYFREIFLCYFLLVFPTSILGLILAALLVYLRWVSEIGAAVTYIFVYLFFSTIATMAITVIVSDVCLGQSPGIWRTFRRLSIKSIGKLWATTLLFYLMIFLVYMFWAASFLLIAAVGLREGTSESPKFAAIFGLLMIASVLIFLISLLILVVLTLFYPTVVVLEKRWGFNALRRSAQLGRGYYLRTLLIFLLMFLLVFIGGYVVQLGMSLLLGGAGYVVGYFLSFVIAPLGSIYIVLLYYDLRVRKEGYDADTLEADLRR